MLTSYLNQPLEQVTADTNVLKRLKKLGLTTFRDALFHLPLRVQRRIKCQTLAEVRQHLAKGVQGVTFCVPVKITSVEAGGGRGSPIKIYAIDSQKELLTITYFNGNIHYLRRRFPLGEKRAIDGAFTLFNGEVTVGHPDYVMQPQSMPSLPEKEVIYPTTAGLTQIALRKVIQKVVQRLPQVEEWLPESLIKDGTVPMFAQALYSLHDGVDNPEPFRKRLALDEMCAHQLKLQLIKRQAHESKAPRVDVDQLPPVEDVFGFQFTPDQQQALQDILADLKSGKRMYRLIQGDVGCGKTAVAFMSALPLIRQGCQVALLAPTEILAQQHFASFEQFAKPLNIKVELITRKDKTSKAGKEKLAHIASGNTHIIIGTHAIIQKDVQFNALGLAIVDEQHRFGVQQRRALTGQNEGVHALFLTATPIPRTLNLLAYGDLDVSLIKTKPAERKPIVTTLLQDDKIDSLLDRLGTIIQAGGQAYWVCPLIEESEAVDLTHLNYRFESIQKRFPGLVGFVHGKMKAAEKQAQMDAFANGETKILVATTVIEVGVNVPNATVMIIEHAERYGLSQLHQLRGRVGRGAQESYCVLVYKAAAGRIARQRLNTLKDSNDGFFIAEEDFKLRGAGDVLGERQSGEAGFRCIPAETIATLAPFAAKVVRIILEEEPTGSHPLIEVFGLEAAEQLLVAG